MDAAVARALAALNRRFYAHHADAFSRSRHRPWPGWRRILDLLPPSGPLAVLDVGCGDGRFARYLGRSRPDPVDYLGLDVSPELLARATSDDGVRFARCDVLGDDLERLLGERRFGLIVLFGLLHHLPGRARRHHLLARLATRLAPAGLLVATVWRLESDPRFSRRRLSWERYNAATDVAIDVARLEPGDHLLTFAGDVEHPRYCHAATADEFPALVAAPGLELVARFDADGHSGDRNRYLVWRR